MSKKLYEDEILNTKIEANEDEKLINSRYKKLNGIMEAMYDFVLAYSNYYSIRRDYGTGEKFTMIEIHILTEICDNSGITVTELAEKWCRTSSAISQTVKKLIKWGFVNRISNENNGKIFHLSITEKGKELALIHKRYDNLDIVKTKKKLLKKFTIEELIAFDKICKEYTNILRYKKDKNMRK
ncbi:MarR family transcriptional regulator [Fusobacterium animalis]|uniref:MarR family transcriptional regulator n=1 Tax=Fusobacterium animalis TaxID=76859 RepID=UPI0034DF4594